MYSLPSTPIRLHNATRMSYLTSNSKNIKFCYSLNTAVFEKSFSCLADCGIRKGWTGFSNFNCMQCCNEYVIEETKRVTYSVAFLVGSIILIFYCYFFFVCYFMAVKQFKEVKFACVKYCISFRNSSSSAALSINLFCASETSDCRSNALFSVRTAACKTFTVCNAPTPEVIESFAGFRPMCFDVEFFLLPPCLFAYARCGSFSCKEVIGFRYSFDEWLTATCISHIHRIVSASNAHAHTRDDGTDHVTLESTTN